MDDKSLALRAEGLHPQAPPARPPGPAAPTSGHRPIPGAIGVVLASGQGMFRQGLAALLTAAPEVDLLDQVADGESAWQAIQARAPDIAILDLALALTGGIEVARRTVAGGLPTRCLILATQQDPALAVAALRTGAAGYVLMHNEFDELMLALRSIDGGGTFVSPLMAATLRERRRNGQPSESLSPREREVVRLLAAGKHSKEIARILAISPQTVDSHRRRLMKKLGLHASTEVVRYAAQSGLLG